MWAHSERETLSFPTHTHRPTQTDAHGATWTHTDLHTHQQPTLRQSGWGQLCSPYGAQTQLGCPRVWLWGGARASVTGVGLSASVFFPPSKDTYHTPVRSCPSVEPGSCTGPTGSDNAPWLLCSHRPLPGEVVAKGQPGHGRYTVHAGTPALPLASSITSESFPYYLLLKTNLRQTLLAHLPDQGSEELSVLGISFSDHPLFTNSRTLVFWFSSSSPCSCSFSASSSSSWATVL